jgi:alpha/beta superfamily hydrolase
VTIGRLGSLGESEAGVSFGPSAVRDSEGPISRRSPVSEAIDSNRQEEGYLAVGGEQVYYVRHRVSRPRSVAILAGPFSAERAHVYISWVRWARYLAANGVETYQFDYRGTGESTGRFEENAFRAWLEDLKAVTQFARTATPGCPLVLQGYRMGALLAAKAFASGLGNALLLWFPPTAARDMLYESLRQRIIADFGTKAPGERVDRDHYMERMRQGETVEVEGYVWTGRLIAEADEFPLELPPQGDARPSRIVRSHPAAGPLATPYARPPNPRARTPERPLNPDLSAFFASQYAWFASDFASDQVQA